MRATLTTISVAALLATAGPASARPADVPPSHSAGAPRYAAAMRTQAARGPARQSLRNEQLAAVAASRRPAPAPSVRVTRVVGGGFDWADAGIGAGLTAAVLLTAAGLSTLRRQHAPATR
jgi:hypothetical protein